MSDCILVFFTNNGDKCFNLTLHDIYLYVLIWNLNLNYVPVYFDLLSHLIFIKYDSLGPQIKPSYRSYSLPRNWSHHIFIKRTLIGKKENYSNWLWHYQCQVQINEWLVWNVLLQIVSFRPEKIKKIKIMSRNAWCKMQCRKKRSYTFGSSISVLQKICAHLNWKSFFF